MNHSPTGGGQALLFSSITEISEKAAVLISSSKSHDGPDIEELFRAFHTIKGLAAQGGLVSIEAVARSVESLLSDAMRTGRIESGWIPMLSRAVELCVPGDQGVEAVAEAEDIQTGLEMAAAAVKALPSQQSQKRSATHFQPPPTGGYIEVDVTIDPASRMPAARALVVLKCLEETGDFIHSEPSRTMLRESDASPTVLRIRMKPEAEAGEIRRLLEDLPDIHLDYISRVAASALKPAESVSVQVRVDAEVLDRILGRVSDVFMYHEDLNNRLPDDAREAVRDSSRGIRRSLKELEIAVEAARLVPLRTVTGTMKQSIRAMAQKVGKEINVSVDGDDAELDLSILERLGSILVHLARNAVDHGIEDLKTRVAAGKPPAGTIRLSVTRVPGGISLTFSDDGRGIDFNAARIAAGKMGFVEPLAGSPTERELLDLLFTPGFSTAQGQTELSGRGVGLDAARRFVTELGGTFSIKTGAGRGTVFTMEIPCTMTRMQLMLVEAGGGTYAIPAIRITEVFSASAVKGEEGVCIDWRGKSVPAVDMSHMIRGDTGTPCQDGPGRFLILERQGKQTAVRVENVFGLKELVVRPLGFPLNSLNGLTGVALLNLSTPVLVVDAMALSV